jgi:serine/threonine-protein kinase
VTTELRDQLQHTLGKAYTLERELRGGGMSRVFVAKETALGRRIVVKILAPGREPALDVLRPHPRFQSIARSILPVELQP